MLRLAWRNLWRNRTRTLISVNAIALSYAMFLVSMGLADSSYSQLEESAAQAAGGSVLIHRDGYWDRQLNDLVMTNAEVVVAEVQATAPEAKVARRVLVDGLLSTSAGNAPVRMKGVDPRQEQAFQEVEKYVVEGTFLGGAEPDPIVLGRDIVDELEVELGDRVILTATDPSGELRRSLFHLSGVIESGSKSMDEVAAFTSLEAAQKALGVPGGLTQIGILAPRETRYDVRDALRARLGGAGDLEVMTWDEAMPDLVGMIELDAAFGDIYGLIVFVVVVFAVMNTFLMIVMERIREFGLLSAIGLKPRQIGVLLLLESLLLATVSIALGFALGFALHTYLSVHGVDLASIYGTEVEMGGVSMTDTIIRSEIRPRRWAGATFSVFILTVLAAAYPAWKAARLTPSQAMRFYH